MAIYVPGPAVPLSAAVSPDNLWWVNIAGIDRDVMAVKYDELVRLQRSVIDLVAIRDELHAAGDKSAAMTMGTAANIARAQFARVMTYVLAPWREHQAVRTILRVARVDPDLIELNSSSDPHGVMGWTIHADACSDDGAGLFLLV